MNKPDLLETIKQSELAIPAGLLAVGVLLVVIFLTVFTLPKFSELKKCQQAVSAESMRLSQYKSLNSFTATLNGQRQKIGAIMANPDINSEKSTDTIEGISALAATAGVKLETVSADAGENGNSWNITFIADTQQLVSFLATAERNFRVKTMLVASKENSAPQVSINIGDITKSDVKSLQANNISADTKGDLFDLGQKAIMYIEQIQKIENERSVAQVKRDVFSDRINEPAPAKAKPKKVSAKKAFIPQAHLEAISWDPYTPVAVIEGMALKEGDTYNEIHVVKINRKSVQVKWRSNDITLELQTKEIDKK